MPAAYLAAAVLAGSLYASGWLAPQRSVLTLVGPPSLPPAIDANVSVLSQSPSQEPTEVPVTRANGAVLLDPDSLRRKVLVTGRKVIPRKTPEGEPKGKELSPLAIRFVFAETSSMFQVGMAAGEPEGWVFRDDVVEWDTRLVARPTNRSSRPGIEIFAEQACLTSAWNGRTCARHGGRCPSEIENGDGGEADPRIGWPILRFGSMTASDGSARQIDEVVPLVTEAVPTESERLAPLRPALRQVYVVFVIDTTASMRATIDAARTLATGLTTAVTKQFGDVTLHLGLIEYRDDAPGLGFRARVATPFTDAAGFRAVINSLEAALREDVIPGESVLEGLALALPGTPGGLDWPNGRVGELATKLVVLLGDAPDHARDLDRTSALAARARAAGISIATVALDRPGNLSTDDRVRLEAQWRALAEGAYRPPDRPNQFAGPTPPLSIRIDGSTDLPARLQALIEDRVERARQLAELAAAEDDGRLDDYLRGRNLTRTQAAPFLDELRRANPAPKRTRRQVPSLRTGWLAERLGDTQFVTVEILLSRDELDTLITRLSAMPRDADDLRAIVNATASGELNFLNADRRSLSAEDQVKRRHAFPSGPAAVTDLNTRLRAAVSGLTKLRDSISWSDPNHTADGRASVPFDLIDF